jgi:subtilase family serine protease
MEVKNIDKKLLYLMRQLFKMSTEDENKFLEMISSFSEQEKIDLAYDLWQRIQAEENIITRFYNKVKSIYNKHKEAEQRQKENPEELLAAL